MKFKELIEQLQLQVKTNNEVGDIEITHGYASDLLSDVLAHAHEGDLWVTVQTHQNIAAVATVKGLAGIVLIGGRQPEAETLKKADKENIPVMVSELSAFELIGKLYALGVSGTR